MKVIRLSHTLGSTTPLYGGANEIRISPRKSLSCGDTCNTFFLEFPNHSSTHVDAPFHFLGDGKKLDEISSENWVFKHIAIIDQPARSSELLNFDPLAAYKGTVPEQIEIVLIRTGFEKKRGTKAYWEENPGLDPALAERLKAAFPRLRAVGMDFISTSAFQHREKGRLAHHEFLGREILLIEDMSLIPLTSTPDLLVVAPLIVEGLDGAPVTIFAISN